MRIYIALEYYPSIYKPYFDTQFVDFIKKRNSLQIYSVQHQGDCLKFNEENICLMNFIRHYPATLKHVPRHVFSVLKNLLKNPRRRVRAIFSIYDQSFGYKKNFINIIRMLVLPLEPPDLFLIHNLVTATHFHFLRSFYGSVPIILYYHGGEVAGVNAIKYDQAKASFSYPDMILTNTISSKKHAVSRGAEPDKVLINKVGFDINQFKIKEPRNYKVNGIFRMISIGRMSFEKGFIYALEAVKILINAGVVDIRYELIGDGPELDSLRKYVISNNLQDYIYFHGHESSRKKLFERVSASDALLLPSVPTETCDETQGCVVQEAMLLKAIVITSRTGGVPESIPSLMTRFSFQPGRSKDIAKCIMKAKDLTRKELDHLGEYCRKYTIENFNIEILNQAIISCADNIRGRAH